MTKTLLVTALLALLAVPLAVAQHGPPPGYTDPTVYAQDHAAAQAAQAQADPVGYATSRDAAAEAEHTAWLACWTAYEASGHALDAACAPFFTAPVSIDPAVEGATAEVTQVLNDTGVDALLDESLDAVNDTLADPASALDQVARVAQAAIRFVEDLVEFVLDALGLGALAIAAGLLGATQGLLGLAAMPLAGLELAASGLAAAGAALLSTLGLAGDAAASTASSLADGVLGAVHATLGAIADGARSAASDLAAALGAVGSAVAAAANGAVDGVQATVQGVADAADALQDGVADAVRKVGELLDGKPAKQRGLADDGLEAPKTGTEADGLIDRLLGSL